MKTMTLATILIAALAAGLPGRAGAKAGEERWIAVSRTAMGITGDIVLSPTALKMAGVTFPLKVAADLRDYRNDLDQSVAARVLAVTRPMDPKLLRGNRFGCGKPIRWIVVYRRQGGAELGMETFTGAAMPHSVKESGFCGSYGYARK